MNPGIVAWLRANGLVGGLGLVLCAAAHAQSTPSPAGGTAPLGVEQIPMVLPGKQGPVAAYAFRGGPYPLDGHFIYLKNPDGQELDPSHGEAVYKPILEMGSRLPSVVDTVARAGYQVWVFDSNKTLSRQA